MEEDKFGLCRFVKAQDGVYQSALNELTEGRKRSHWMWYIFPQLKQLGYSYNSKYYGISGREKRWLILRIRSWGLACGRYRRRISLCLPMMPARCLAESTA